MLEYSFYVSNNVANLLRGARKKSSTRVAALRKVVRFSYDGMHDDKLRLLIQKSRQNWVIAGTGFHGQVPVLDVTKMQKITSPLLDASEGTHDDAGRGL
eukprot:6189390-Pleurochrysis_carterae.AAC.1